MEKGRVEEGDGEEEAGNVEEKGKEESRKSNVEGHSLTTDRSMPWGKPKGVLLQN